MPLFKPKKETPAEGSDRSILPRLSSLLARIEEATAYGNSEPLAPEAEEEDAGTEPCPPPPDEEAFAEAFQGLETIRREAVDRALADLLKEYIAALERKHSAWLWLQNNPEASLPEQDRVWGELVADDNEAASLRAELDERIRQLGGTN